MSLEQKHILFLPRWYPNRYDPMWGLFVKKHAEAVSLLNQVSILYLHPIDNGQNQTEFIEEKKDHLYTLYIYYPKPNTQIAYFFTFFMLYFKGIKMIEKRRKVDLVHVHILTRMGLLAWITSFTRRWPYVVTEHWSRYLPSVNIYAGSLRKLLTKWVVKRAQVIMPVTSNLKEAMESHGLYNSNYQIVPNVVDDSFFNTKFNESATKRVIHVSTFEDRSKNISGIIEAIKEISASRQDFKMVFIGEGIDFKRMKALVKDLGLNEMIEFTGLLEKEALVKEYARASFMIINSNYENMPVVINEAMACGLPVLSTNVGGISEHLDSSKGVLIHPNDTLQLLEQFNWMLNHYSDYNKAAIREYAETLFSSRAVCRKLNNIYHSF